MVSWLLLFLAVLPAAGVEFESECHRCVVGAGCLSSQRGVENKHDIGRRCGAVERLTTCTRRPWRIASLNSTSQ